MFVRAIRQKVHGSVVICTFCRSAQHRPNGPLQSNMAATLARLGVNFGQQCPNFGPTWINWPQLRPNLAPRWFFYYRQCFVWSNVPRVVSPLGPTWCEAVAKGAKLRRARNDLDFHVHHMASIWNPSGSLWAQLHLNNLRQFALNNRAQDSATCAHVWARWAPAQPEPFLRTQWGTLKTCVLPLCPRFFGFDGGSCEAMSHIGLVLGPLLRQMPPCRIKLHMLSPTCIQRCPSCAMLDPSWAQVGANWPQLKAKDGRVWPQSAFGWAKLGPLLSSPSNSLGAGGSRREATGIQYDVRGFAVPILSIEDPIQYRYRIFWSILIFLYLWYYIYHISIYHIWICLDLDIYIYIYI